MRAKGFLLGAALALSACGSDPQPPGDDDVVTTERCSYEPVAATAHAGGAVTAGQLRAGTADRVLHIPVGTALGGYTGRAGFISSAGEVDARAVAMPGVFNPSIGVSAAPRVKALALAAGDETVILLKADIIFAYEGLVFDLEQRLGPEFAGKVMFATSHSHSGWAQFSSHAPLKLGGGERRDIAYQRYLSDFEAAARAALAALTPAKIGIFTNPAFDLDDAIQHDRRGENDGLPGGKNHGDEQLFLFRIDRMDGSPLAIVPIFGEHGTLNGEDNPFASTDAPGAVERALAEQFDSEVLVMHLQSAGADTSPSGHGGVDCNVKPGRGSDPCFTWANEEGHGRAAVPELMAAWASAGAAMRDSIELSMVTRSVETGPFPETFSIRGGALGYAKFDRQRTPDRVVFDGSGALANPIDEFNAPIGAGLCEKDSAMFPAAAIPGTEGVPVYGSCLQLDLAAEVLGPIFDISFDIDEHHPVCESTRTTLSALRIGEHVIGTMPGELSVLLANHLREQSPVGAGKTILVGYAQGHVGYLLRPEDWVLGGYEPSITFWGPLEAEYLGEQLLDLIPAAMSQSRIDTGTGGTKLATPISTDNLEIDDPAPMAGTIPATIPATTWSRTGTPTQAQPAATIPRISGIATFTWVGDDPAVQTPHVTLEFESAPGTFTPVRRRSGRIVDDAELLLAYTPSPLQRSGPQTHVWVVEWQAVPWLGAPTVDALDARGGVPLGRYRFHVVGKGWTLDSDPFRVVAGGLEPVNVARAGATITATASWNAPKGWRLLHMTAMSNRPVPIGGQQVTIELLNQAGAVLTSTVVTTNNSGVGQVADDPQARQIRITDRFGNQGTAAIP